MTSEFNPVSVREKFKDFDGRIKEQMPLVLADSRYPMFITELFGQRAQGRGISRYIDTGDLVAYNGPKSDVQEIKFILTANKEGLTDLGRHALSLINPNSGYINQAVNLNDAVDATGKKISGAYETLQGNGVITLKRKDFGIIDTPITLEQFLNHKGWRVAVRHPDEVPKEFAEDFERAKEYAGRLVFSRYNNAMGMYLASGEKVPTLRAWCVVGLGDYRGSYASGNWDLDSGGGRLVGVAPEAPIALGTNASQITEVKSYTHSDLQAFDDAVRGLEVAVKPELLSPLRQLRKRL